MHDIIYLVGLVVIVLFILSALGAHSGEGGQRFRLIADTDSGRWRTAFR